MAIDLAIRFPARSVDICMRVVANPLLPALWGFLLTTIAAIPLHAQVEIKVTPGFDGDIVPGRTNPLTVRVKNEGKEFRGFARVDVDGRTDSIPVLIPAKSTSLHRMLFPGSGVGFTVRFVDEQGNPLFSESGRARPIDGPVLMTVRQDGLRFNGNEIRRGMQYDLAEIDVEDFPETFVGLEPADMMFLGGNSVEQMNERQVVAVVKWVARGGILLLECGRKSDILRATALREILPASIKGSVTIDKFDGFASLAGETIKYEGKMSVTTLEETPAVRTVIWNGDLPIAAEGTSGFGVVALLLFDMDAMPVRSLAHRERFFLGIAGRIDDGWRQRNASRTTLGMNDSVRVTFFNRIPPQKNEIRVPLTTILPYLIAFLLIIGPLDYYVLRMINRLEWTWFTFALTAIVATAAALFIIYDFKKGRLLFDRLTVVVQSPDGKCSVATSFANIHSQSNQYYSVTSPADVAIDIAHPLPTTIDIARSRETKLSGYYVPIWTNGGIVTSSVAMGPRLRLSMRGDRLTTENRFPFPLEGGVILRGEHWFVVPEVAAGEGEIVVVPIDGLGAVTISSDPRCQEIARFSLEQAFARCRRPTFVGWAGRLPEELTLSDAEASVTSLTLVIAEVDIEEEK